MSQREESKEGNRDDYTAEMSDKRFDTADLCTPLRYTNISSLARVNREVRCLGNDLPCSAGAAVYVRVDRSTLTHFQALISGPPDTPYAYGLYLFDIHLPANFPFEPPVVEILTTGNGTVRFNPNLYNNGKVCLSLINTWEGAPEEKWRASCTIVQVLVTIQSMILDKAVAQREPGFESYSLDSEENLAYSNVIKYANLLWAMREMIRAPPRGFETVVHSHFRLTKALIAREVANWIASARDLRPQAQANLTMSHNGGVLGTVQSIGMKRALTQAYQQLEVELARLA